MHMESDDVVAFLERQHADVRDALGSLRAHPDSALLDRLVRMLAVHETAEEMVIYPALRAEVPDGDAIADARIAEETQSKQDLAALESMGVEDERFEGAIGAFADAVLQHASNEEKYVFPLLREHVDAERLRTMEAELRTAEATAPTHAHRLAPSSGIGNLLRGPIVSLFDRIRDALRGRRTS